MFDVIVIGAGHGPRGHADMERDAGAGDGVETGVGRGRRHSAMLACSSAAASRPVATCDTASADVHFIAGCFLDSPDPRAYLRLHLLALSLGDC